MPTKLKKRDKQEKTTPISFRVDDITRSRLKTLSAYYRKGLTSIVEELIDQEYERLEKKDPHELKKAESFVD
jgi:predicted DNA-binding protein